MKRLRQRILPPLLLLAILLVGWELLVRADTNRVHILPAPSAVLGAFFRDAHLLFTVHIPITLLEAGLGLLIAILIGAGLAALLDVSSPLKRAIYPLLILSQTIPIIAIAPALILIFGFGIGAKVITVILFTFFPIAVALIDGLAATDPDYVALLRAMGAGRGRVWWAVRLPAALPSFFSGVRIAATYAISGAILGEFITAQSGLGRYLRASYNSGSTDATFAAVGISALISVALVVLVGIIERWLMPWFFTDARAAQWEEPGIY
ncbi:MAG TPA: ABC transporter permease [Aggregatilineales bacterium]|nr:ABC transporter permease [Anaerolineales bacterium]HRE49471.1 ABC transporter permease [Aggregatilineales bacterium]